jgi:hypothetical protein
MPASFSKHVILKVAKRLQQLPLGNPSTPEELLALAAVIQAAAQMLPEPASAQGLKGREAAAASACGIAALQSAGWLMQAVKVLPRQDAQAVQAAHTAVDACMVAAQNMLVQVDLGVDLLRAVLRPSLGGTAPGEGPDTDT